MALTVRATLLQSRISKCGSFPLHKASWLLPTMKSRLRVIKIVSGRRSMEADVTDWEQSCADQGEKVLVGNNREHSVAGGRREALMSMILFSLSAQMARAEDSPQDVAPLELKLFSDAKDGFTLLRPADWNKVDKPGATVYFEDPQSSKNNIGVTVNPVRISSLKAFGTVDDVTEKLISAERDKPSTKEMQVVRVQERQLLKDTPLYQLEYILDTSRGSKRVLTAVTVWANKLFILNIIYIDGSKTPAPGVVNDALHKVLNSFDLLD